MPAARLRVVVTDQVCSDVDVECELFVQVVSSWRQGAAHVLRRLRGEALGYEMSAFAASAAPGLPPANCASTANTLAVSCAAMPWRKAAR